MFSVPVNLKNKNDILKMFETLATFPNKIMMLKNGENIVDAHSIMGFFAIDESLPIELLLETEPDDTFIHAISKYISV